MLNSPAADVEVTTQVETEASPDVTANSSPAEGAEKKVLLDVVHKALQRDTEASPGSDNQDSKAEAAAAPGELPDDISEEELKQYPKPTARRIRQFLTERAESRKAIADLEPKAKNFDQIASYMQHHRLSNQEVDAAFSIMADMKGNPKQALAKLAPLVRDLMKAAGLELSDDLQKDVKDGVLPEDRARALSEARAENARLAKEAERLQEMREADRLASTTKATVDTAVSTGNEWFAKKAQSDPDWSLKQGRFLEAVELEIRRTGKYPASKEETQKLCEDALKRVEKELKSFIPAKRDIKPPIAGSASTRSSPQPKTVLEAVQQNLARM